MPNSDRDDDREHDYLYIHLPGDTEWGAHRVHRGEPSGAQVWGWNGNRDRPTLTPSIIHDGKWHGYLRAGRLESV